MARRVSGGADPRRDEEPSCSRPSETGSANEGLQVPHRRRLGVFSRFAWPLPDGRARGRGSSPRSSPAGPASTPAGRATCPTGSRPRCTRSSSTARVDEQPLKVVAPRGRLIRRVDAWDDRTREAYGRMCFARADELVAAAPTLDGWAPPPRDRAHGVGAARLHRRADRRAARRDEAHLEERRRQSEWLVEHLALD